jgi:serine/threonine-protein kinase
MAPEQVLGRPLTMQADVYSFGVVLYELFTGKKPFVGESVEKIFEQVIYKPIDLELLAKSGAPQVVQDIVAKCTAKKLMERPESMAPVFEALQKAEKAATVAPVTAGPAVQPPSEPGKLSRASSENYARLGMLPKPDAHMPQHAAAELKQNATTPAPKAPENKANDQGNQTRSLAMAAGGAVIIAFLIYMVVRFAGG